MYSIKIGAQKAYFFLWIVSKCCAIGIIWTCDCYWIGATSYGFTIEGRAVIAVKAGVITHWNMKQVLNTLSLKTLFQNFSSHECHTILTFYVYNLCIVTEGKIGGHLDNPRLLYTNLKHDFDDIQ